jgi:putative flippase GtrA
MNEMLALPFWLSTGISVVLSVLWNFTFNRRYTFRSDMNVPKAMFLVFLYYLVFTPLSMWTMDVLTHRGVNEYIVKGCAMLVNFITEFLYQRFVVYSKTIDTNDEAKKAESKDA